MATDGSLAEESLVLAPATAEQSAAVHAALDRFWAAVDAAVPEPPSRAWRLAFATAVVEIATNVMRHAYPADVPDRGLSLQLRGYADQVVAWLVDQGIPVPAATLAGRPPTDDALDLAEGGYGLALARACVDVLEYYRTPDGTNCWRLVKRLVARAPETQPG